MNEHVLKRDSLPFTIFMKKLSNVNETSLTKAFLILATDEHGEIRIIIAPCKCVNPWKKN
jgi:hypothetical protein